MRFVSWKSLLIGLAILLVAMPVLVAAMTLVSPGRSALARTVSYFASTPENRIDFGRLDGIWSGELRLERVTLSDAKGPYVEIRDISLDWSPSALLSGRFQADRVGVGSVIVQRAPQPGDAVQSTSNEPVKIGLPSLPVDVLVQSIDVPVIDIDRSITGISDRLTLSGRVEILSEPVRLLVDLSVKTQNSGGALVAKSAFNPANDQLELDAELSWPKGSLLAKLAGIAGEPALDFSVIGSGPLSDWSGQLALVLDGKKTVGGTASVDLINRDMAIRASLNGKLAPIMPYGAAALFAGDTEIALDLMKRVSGGLEIKTARVTSYSSNIQATGRIVPNESLEELRIGIDLGKRNGVEFDFGQARLGASRVTAEIDGPWTGARASITGAFDHIDAAGAKLDGIALKLDATAIDLTNQAFDYAARLSVLQSAATDPALAGLVAGRMRLETAGQFESGILSVRDMRLQNPVLGLALAGTYDTATGFANLGTELAVRAGPHIASLKPLGDGMLRVRGSLQNDPQSGLRLSDLSVSSQNLTASGDLALVKDQISANIAGTFSALSAISPQISGGLAFSATADGFAHAPKVDLTLNGENIELQGKPLEDLKVAASGHASSRSPSGTVSASAQFSGAPLTLSANLVSSADGNTNLERLRFEAAGARLDGTARLSSNNIPSGKFTIQVADFAALGPLLLQEGLAGTLSGTLDLIERDKTLDVNVKADLGNFRYQNIGVPAAAIAATVRDALTTPAINGTVRTTSITGVGVSVTGLNAEAKQSGNRTIFDVAATVDGAPVSVAGRAAPVSDGGYRVLLDRLKGAYRGLNVALAGKSDLTIRNGSVAIEPTRLNVAGGQAVVSGRAGNDLNLGVQLAGINLGALNPIIGNPGLAGRARGRVAVSGSASDPAVGFELAISGASAGALKSAGIPPLAVASRGRYASNRVSLNTTQITGGGGLNLAVNGSVALSPVSLGLKVAGKVPFSLVERQLAQNGLRLTGGADVDIAVNGPAVAPQISGRMNANGTFVETRSNITINDLKAAVTLGQNTLTVTSLTGNFSKGGSLNAKGTIGTNPSTGFPADLDIALSRVKYNDGSVVDADFGGNVKVTGKLAGAPQIGGVINVAEANITIPESVGGTAALLGVSHKNASKKVSSQAAKFSPPKKKQSGGGGPTLNLTVDAPRRIFVRGRGLDAELGGRITLQGPASAPRALGGFRLISGKFDILTRRLDFNRGNIGFSGSLDPTLDFVASSQVDDATVSINVGGRASSPKITFTSNPTLPQDEVVARFVFGKSLSSLSALQVAQLAGAVSTLSGKGGAGLVEKLRKGVGVDNLDVTNDDKSGVTVKAEKYVTDRVKIGAAKGAKSGSGKVTIDFDINKFLKARGELGEKGSSKGGLFFEREY
ncbi:MAG: translocation/assembly module TamB domain-containing protein [Pseudomonadota bacterium]